MSNEYSYTCIIRNTKFILSLEMYKGNLKMSTTIHIENLIVSLERSPEINRNSICVQGLRQLQAELDEAVEGLRLMDETEKKLQDENERLKDDLYGKINFQREEIGNLFGENERYKKALMTISCSRKSDPIYTEEQLPNIIADKALKGGE